MAEEKIHVDEHREYSFVPVKKKKMKIRLEESNVPMVVQAHFITVMA